MNKKYDEELKQFINEIITLSFLDSEEKQMYCSDRLDLIEREDNMLFTESEREYYKQYTIEKIKESEEK